MGILQNLLFTICIALRCVTSAEDVIHVSGYLGSKVKVSCSYDEGYESYEKYLCKNDCGSDDVLITTSNPVKNKYTIRDDEAARIFTATISDLHSADVGKYWCGVSRTGKDIYTEVELKLVQDSCCDTVTKIQSYEGYSESIVCPYESQYQSNLKYICRGNQPSTCLQQALITSDNKENERFRLDDDKVLGTFTVTISGLTQNDPGSYLCGVRRNSDLDIFSAVELEVKEWCCVESTKIKGTVGEPLTLQCLYPPLHRDNRKFLCKGDHRNNCKNITSQSRFRLEDNVSSSSFSVMITELEEADAGTYWCGSDSQWRPGNYTKIQLSVAFLQQSSTLPSLLNSTVETLGKNSTQIPGQYVVYIVSPVLLLLMCIFAVIVYNCKHQTVKEDEAVMNRNAQNEDDLEEVTDAAENNIYGNQEVVMCKKTTEMNRTMKTEEICLNENFHKANKR